MKTMLACLLVSVLAIGCSNDQTKALAKIIESCEPGGIVTLRGSLSTWGNKIEGTCVWTKKEEK